MRQTSGVLSTIKVKTLASVQLWSFFFDGPKLVRFWPKPKLVRFWPFCKYIVYIIHIKIKAGLTKLGYDFRNTVSRLKLSKNVTFSPKLMFLKKIILESCRWILTFKWTLKVRFWYFLKTHQCVKLSFLRQKSSQFRPTKVETPQPN